VRHHVSQHDTGVVAPGRSDSGRRRTSRGRGGRGYDRGGGGRGRREAQRLTVGRDDMGARWTAAGCRRAR
jgi:hypothetical protein